ncbi:hypothetical protein C8R45DRAFT_1205511 [Mycena sanguinolenta]|nr:hypothetical protein C8R45DRAFT_1205511 [Mycena sanguinolenta]
MSNTKLHVPNALDAHLQDVVLTFGVTGVVLPALLLLTIAYAAWNPVSRHFLNRVSFRLLVCALISNLIFAATSIPVFSRPSAGCSFMAFFGLSILMFSACMFFCIALNLQLVLVHHINGNSMEKFYYISSVAVVAILNIAPYAAGQFGYYNGTCWFSSPRPDVQFHWLLGSQSVWMLLMSTGEVVSFSVILGYMYRASRVFPVIQKPPIVAYRSMILRIGLYPLLSCWLSFTGSILDIWLTKHPIPTELPNIHAYSNGDSRLSVRLSNLLIYSTPSRQPDLCVFALRPILYTVLAASDPGFLCAMRALRKHSKSAPSTVPTSNITFTNSTTWVPRSSKSRMEQSSAALRSFEEQTAINRGGTSEAIGKPSFTEQSSHQSELSQAERGKEVEVEVEVEAQTCSVAEDIVRQI